MYEIQKEFCQEIDHMTLVGANKDARSNDLLLNEMTNSHANNAYANISKGGIQMQLDSKLRGRAAQWRHTSY